LELAIGLGILGIISVFLFPIANFCFSYYKDQVTKENQTKVCKAITSYLSANNSLPLPSISTDGLENNLNTFVGIIPFKTIGLSEKNAKDGYGNWFTYMVHPKLSTKGLKGFVYKKDTSIYDKSEYFCEIFRGEIFLEGLDGQHANLLEYGDQNNPWDDFIAFAIISHGKKGQGAFSFDLRSRNPITSDDNDKQINSSSQLKFVDKQSYDKGVGSFFDDTVVWCSRNNLMSYYLGTNCRWDME
jgi:hypothetical protein